MVYSSPLITQTIIEMGTIAIEGMQFHAYHGCFKEERIIGTKFMVDLHFETNTSLAQDSDSLRDTIDYQSVFLMVKEEMKKPSSLLEHVGRRILDRLFIDFPAAESASLKISKIHPPLGGEVHSVSVTLKSSENG